MITVDVVNFLRPPPVALAVCDSRTNFSCAASPKLGEMARLPGPICSQSEANERGRPPRRLGTVPKGFNIKEIAERQGNQARRGGRYFMAFSGPEACLRARGRTPTAVMLLAPARLELSTRVLDLCANFTASARWSSACAYAAAPARTKSGSVVIGGKKPAGRDAARLDDLKPQEWFRPTISLHANC